ncbi:uncharacterized protein G2W53_037752 [Senna tora]|uniref:Uncharacterized protein n=1 Tax=Senna tora TaxID=362788 RepID=A0A834SL69_9FABA|nr:uncharacterized protein G2W53_037752 [Senna tora]
MRCGVGELDSSVSSVLSLYFSQLLFKSKIIVKMIDHCWRRVREATKTVTRRVRERDSDVDGKNTPAVADGGSIFCSEEARWAGATN